MSTLATLTEDLTHPYTMFLIGWCACTLALTFVEAKWQLISGTKRYTSPYISRNHKSAETVIKGSSLTTFEVAARFRSEDSLAGLREDYPDIADEAFIAAIAYEQANNKSTPKAV